MKSKDGFSINCRRVGLMVLALFSAVFSMWFRNIAEIHIQFPFLSFPIFISEWLFLFCLILFWLEGDLASTAKKPWAKYILIYLAWLCFKVIHGYVSDGPLALRHAVLFYYPFFTLLAFNFFDRKIFQHQWFIIAIVIMLMVMSRYGLNRYFYFSAMMLMIFLIANLKNKTLLYVFSAGFVCLYPWSELFGGARGNIVAFIVSILYLTACLTFVFLKGKKNLQVGFLLLVACFLVFGLKAFANKNKLESLVKLHKVWDRYLEAEEKLKEPLKNYHEKKIDAQLYHPEDKNIVQQFQADPRDRQFDEIFLNRFEELKTGISESPVVDKNTTVHEELDSLKADLAEIAKEATRQIKVKGDDHKEEILAEANKNAQQAFEKIKSNLKEENLSEIDKETPAVATQNFSPQAEPPQTSVEKVEVLEKYYEKLLSSSVTSRDISVEYDNMLFRIYIWRDMLEDIIQNKAWLGVSLGKPQRSKRIEISRMAYGEWSRDGWITPHNSWFHMIYRAGVVGFFLICLAMFVVYFLTKKFFQLKSLKGILLVTILVYWFTLSNFMVVLEFPYYAIPIWSLLGMILAYYRTCGCEKKKVSR